jgi:hypothetical protein
MAFAAGQHFWRREHGQNVEDWVKAEKQLSDAAVAGSAKTKAAQGRQAVN